MVLQLERSPGPPKPSRSSPREVDGIWTTHLVLRDGTSSINFRWNFYPFRTLLRSLLLHLFMEFWTVGQFSMYGT